MSDSLVLGIKPDLELWEAVAVVQMMQAAGLRTIAGGNRIEMQQDQVCVFEEAGMQWVDAPVERKVEFDAAYREIDKAKESYPAVLARVSSISLLRRILSPIFRTSPTQERVTIIVVSPFECREEFKLPWQVWKAIIKHLQSYGVKVVLMGRAGQRAEYAMLTEGAVVSSLSMHEKMDLLASAVMVFGVPNEWTWMATAWKRKVAILYPDDLPLERWFGFDTAPDTLGRVLYTRSQLQIPVILAGVRRLIGAM